MGVGRRTLGGLRVGKDFVEHGKDECQGFGPVLGLGLALLLTGSEYR